jgi:hypothetical protein
MMAHEEDGRNDQENGIVWSMIEWIMNSFSILKCSYFSEYNEKTEVCTLLIYVLFVPFLTRIKATILANFKIHKLT